MNLAFDNVDIDHSGEIDVEDIANFYDATMHPEVMSGKKTVDQVLRSMIDNFEQRSTTRDGKVSRDEFEDYYGSLGACECSSATTSAAAASASGASVAAAGPPYVAALRTRPHLLTFD